MEKRILQDHIEEINELLYSFLPESDELNTELAEAMEYSVLAGGKRLRPMFMQEMYRMFSDGRQETEILHAFMCAIEFIHTYSLVHDDLPAMDNDDYRRGNLTTHAKYGHAAGILVGDALLNWAYETIFDEIEGSTDPSDYMGGISAARVLASKAGCYGMVGGQYIDVYSDKHDDFKIDEEILKYIYKNKTSALIEASMMIGAILGSASDMEIQVVEKMAGYIGMAFQIQDDILDVLGNQELLGKPVGSDARNNKQTYVSIYGIDKAKAAVKSCTDQALEIFDCLRHRNNFLRELIVELITREK